MKPLIVKASRHHDQSIADRQFSIEQSYYELGDFDKKYVSFGGYFGEAGPHVFAAAPELLEALVQMLAKVRRADPNGYFDDMVILNAQHAIAKAKGETK